MVAAEGVAVGRAVNRTRDFLGALGKVELAGVPDAVLQRCEEALLDYIGVTYAGVAAQRSKIVDLMALEDDGPVHPLGSGQGISMQGAVFINGLNAHALDLDDGVNAGIIHLGSPVFSLLLPLASKHRVDGRRFLEAAILGYEAAWTLAFSIQPAHKKRGFHATGTCGMLGAVIAGAHLLNFDQEETFSAFSTALCSITGTLKVLEGESSLKPYNVGKAALLALLSLRMGKVRAKVPDDAMSGEFGFLSLATGRSDVELKEFLLDGRFAITRAYIKPYAACRYCHPAIEAAIALKKEIGDAEMESILVRTYDLAIPGHDHTSIDGPSSAKMSIPYGVGVGLFCGSAGLEAYGPSMVNDPRVREIVQMVKVEADPAFSEAFPQSTSASVTIALRDGRTVEARVDHPKGEPEAPLGFEGACDKFLEMTAYAGCSPAWQQDVIEAVEDVERRMSGLLDLLKEQ